MPANQSEINNIVWSACDTFRGVIDPAQYKDYILTMLFLKYVSDVYDAKYQQYAEKYDHDEARIQFALQRERFVVPPTSHFDYLYEHRNENNVGELINIALNDLEEHNRDKFSSEDGSGVFRNIDFNSSNLGDAKTKNDRLRKLLADFHDPRLDLRPTEKDDGRDILGDAYEFLISRFASDAGKKAGEFYTPPQVSTLLARLTKSQPGARICDPACGSASLLIKAGKEVEGDNFSLYGQESNGSTWALAKMNMFLHGFDSAIIRWGDTLNNPKLKENDALMRFDTVVANPPFSLKKWAGEGENYKDPADDEFNRFHRGVPPKSRGDWAFITHMIETSHEATGQVGVVVPHGVLFRGSTEGKIRKRVIEENLLTAVIGLPANLFFGTGIPAAILIFRRGRPEEQTDVLFVDASEHYGSGRNQNHLRDADLDKIVGTFRRFVAGELPSGEVEAKFSYVATRAEIMENDFNLNIPRYVDTFEPEPPVDMAAVAQRISELEGELATTQNKMKQYLAELDL